MNRSPDELKEFVENALAMSKGTMRMTLIARDREEFDWLTAALKKTKTKAQALDVRLDPDVVNTRGIGKGRS